jgi:hypothetical protein
MAEYINIRGQNIEVVASDPANPTLGQIWYNSTSNTLKGKGYLAGSWATGGTMSTVGGIFKATVGTQTAALAAGRFTGTPAGVLANTEEYNGSTWTSGGSMGSALYAGLGAGSQTSAIATGGNDGSGAVSSSTESYNGTSWSAETTLPARNYGAGAGTSETAAIVFCGQGGNFGGPPTISETQHYDGSTWTAGGNYPTTQRNLGGCGTSTAALGVGGSNPGTANVNEYDGTSWSSHSTLPAIRYGLGSCGNPTDALVFSGAIPTGATNSTVLWDGVSWTSQGNLSDTAVENCGFNRTQSTSSLGFKYGGTSGVYSSSSEQWTGGAPATVTITAS